MNDNVSEIVLEKYHVYYNHIRDSLYIYFRNKRYSGYNVIIRKDIDIIIDPTNNGVNGLEFYHVSDKNGIKFKIFSKNVIIENAFKKDLNIHKKDINQLIDCANKLIKNGTIAKLIVFK